MICDFCSPWKVSVFIYTSQIGQQRDSNAAVNRTSPKSQPLVPSTRFVPLLLQFQKAGMISHTGLFQMKEAL